MSDVFVCESIGWDNHHGIYWFNIRFPCVIASFDTAGLAHLISHCQQKSISVKAPSDLVGKLFEVRWENDSETRAGNRIDAIRIHPSYGKAHPWLRASQIILTSPKSREEIKLYLEGTK